MTAYPHQQASNDISLFLSDNRGYATYDVSAKAYIINEDAATND